MNKTPLMTLLQNLENFLKMLKTTDKVLFEAALRLMAKTWGLGRVLLEHAKTAATPTDENELSEREELIVRLVELFPDEVSVTTIVKTLGLHFSQAGQTVDRLTKLGIFEKKAGRGAALKLTKTGKIKAQEIELKRGYRFAYVGTVLDAGELEQLKNIMEKMYIAARRQVEERVFGKLPSSINEIIPDKN